MAKDSIGRVWQVATIQLDFNQPRNFGLFCVNEAGEKEPILMVHCAIMGSIERFFSVLIEHFAGAFPLWLAPVQVAVLPVADRHIEAAQALAAELRGLGMRVEVDEAPDSVGKKIRNAETSKVPAMVVLGDKEIEAGQFPLRLRGDKDQAMFGKTELVAKLQELAKMPA
jgi:threonyl-tRNA synthetase